MSTCDSIIVVLCWGEDVCINLGHVERQIGIIVSYHMCPICMGTGVRCCCCSEMGIGTLDMSDAQEIALEVIRQTVRGASRLRDVP